MSVYIMPNSFLCPREKLSVYPLYYKQKEREQVVHTEQLKTPTHSLFTCFWGERRLKIGEKVEARGDE